jgi:cytochrome b6
MSAWGTRIHDWIDERIDLAELTHHLRTKTVPVHYYSIWYYLGGLTLLLFGIQVCTGILLLLYYRPGANEAYESVQYITTQVKFGWLVRSVHSWSANLMILMAFAHMFSVIFLKAYRKPRELTWLSGVVLLFLAMGFGFSGYLLPWNTLAFFATKVGTEIPGQVPIVGKWIMIFLRGGEDVTGATLSRFFGFHVAVLPGIATAILGIHLALVQRLGMSVPPGMESAGHTMKYLDKQHPEAKDEWLEKAGVEKPKEMRFFPNFFLRELIGWYAMLGVLGVLASLFPWELGVKADPFLPAPAGIRPEWYFMFMFQTLKLIPAKVFFLDGEVLGILAFGAAGLVLALVPFLHRGRRSQLIITGAAILALAYIGGMTFYGYLAK